MQDLTDRCALKTALLTMDLLIKTWVWSAGSHKEVRVSLEGHLSVWGEILVVVVAEDCNLGIWW